ncbi:MAG TPA: branched-chain amino acid ABC transporter permease [Thermoleophilia bacterium]|nr:branched-chain amino acid ABC transporter permease [Thermoleophilia bacterium]
MDWVNVALQGVLLGGLFALFATGLALVFGVMRLVNLAHGDLGILAAFVALFLLDSFDIGVFWASLAAVVIMFGIGYVLQRGLLNFTIGTDDTRPILVTFGLSIIIQNGLVMWFSADSQGLDAGRLENASVRLTDQLAVGWYPLIVFVIAVVVIAALQLFLNRTTLGRAFRATSDDQEAAELMGINNRHIYGLAMAIALAIVALAGILLAVRTTFDPSQGPFRLIFAFEAVIMGGMGSIWGTLIGGIVLGVSQTLGAQAFGAGWGIFVGHVVFLTVLAFKPSGFFAKTVTA